MTAALVVGATSLLASALLAVLVRLGLALPASRPAAGAALIVAAELADYTWRAEQVGQVRGHHDLMRAVAGATEEWELRRIHAALTSRHPLDVRPPRGADVIAAWWTPVLGRPPLTTRRVAGATLTGASA